MDTRQDPAPRSTFWPGPAPDGPSPGPAPAPPSPFVPPNSSGGDGTLYGKNPKINVFVDVDQDADEEVPAWTVQRPEFRPQA